MKFREKPVVIDAVQFDTSGPHKLELPDGVVVIEPASHADNYNYMGFKFGLQTREGMIEVKNGDWIIDGFEGERHHCRNDIFQAAYERVEP